MNKALEFEDFILDDYDFNLLEDWDLEYLWEWVELEDFSDLQSDFSGGYGFDPDGDGIASEIQSDVDPPEDDISQNLRQSIQSKTDDSYEFDFDFDIPSDNVDEAYEVPDLSLNTTDNLSEEEAFLRSIGISDEIEEKPQTPENSDENSDRADDKLQASDKSDANIQPHEVEDNLSEEEAFLRSIGISDETEGQSQASPASDLESNVHSNTSQPRYIETSLGVIDLEEDDILSELQKVEFEEFISVLKQHNFIYDKILTQQDWSAEELEFLHSIESFVRDPDLLNEIEENQINNDDDKNHDESSAPLQTQKYATLKDLFENLSKNALILARNNKVTKRYQPKNIRKIWNLDTEDKQAKRIKLIFGEQPLETKQNTASKKQKMPKSVNNITKMITSNNEVRYLEIKEIFVEEIRYMVGGFDAEAFEYVLSDGKRFGLQFLEFLYKKYNSKIYYLLQEQLKSDIVADRFSEVVAHIVLEMLKPKNINSFLLGFFEAIYLTLDKNGIEF